MALSALRTNKLRSILTMLGVTIGVFSVIGVMTALSVIQGSIESRPQLPRQQPLPVREVSGHQHSSDPEEKFANRRNISLEQANEYKRLMEGQARRDLPQGLRRRQAGELRPREDAGTDASSARTRTS